MSVAYRSSALALGTRTSVPDSKAAAAQAVTGVATYTNGGISAVGSMSTVSVQTVFTGTPNGTLSVQVSNDPRAATSEESAVVWDPVVADQTVTAGQIGGKSINTVSFTGAFRVARVVYTNASGTGTVVSYLYGMSA